MERTSRVRHTCFDVKFAEKQPIAFQRLKNVPKTIRQGRALRECDQDIEAIPETNRLSTLSPFLTDLDPRASVKGSRDPLGIQAIWGRFGRYVIGNLSNASSSARDFTILMLGYHFATQVADKAGAGTELATFLKWEQLAAYARAHINGDWGFRGTERVRRNLEENVVTLSTETTHQILSSQKAYGIWGLYSVPGRASGLLDGQPARLSSPAAELVERTYLEILSSEGFKNGNRLVDLLARDRVKIDLRSPPDEKILHAVARLIAVEFKAAERDFYRQHLLYGGPGDSTEGRQRQLAELIEPKLTSETFRWTPATVIALAKEAESRGELWQSLASHLSRIETAERLLAPASECFTYLLGCDGVTVADVTKRMRHKDGWGNRVSTIQLEATDLLRAELGRRDHHEGERWIEIAKAMATGDYSQLIALLIQQNRSVMHSRGGAAWIEDEKGVLKVRVREERGHLPRSDDLKELWRFPYFLNSLCSVAAALKEKGREAQ